MSEDASRRILHSSYTYVRSTETTKSVSSLTLDHLIQERIDSLKGNSKREIVDATGKSMGSRKSRYDKLSELEENIKGLVKAVEDAGDDRAKLEALGIVPDKESTQ